MMIKRYLSNWNNRYKQKGIEGLSDNSRRPHNIKYKKVTSELEQTILDLRLTKRFGCNRIKFRLRKVVGISLSTRTIYKILKRHGLHPAKQEYVPHDYDSVVDRKNDIIYHDRTEFDEFVAILVSDYALLAKSLIKLAEENGASKEALQKILNEKTKAFLLLTGKQGIYDDLVKGRVDVDLVVRLQRKNDSDTISNRTFDFSKSTIQQLIQDGYKETKEQMKEVLVTIKRELSST